MAGRGIDLEVYVAYYEDDRGNKLASSFGWSDNLYLAKMFLITHRLSRDKSCTPHLEEFFYDSTDYDDVHMLVRDMSFYPYTPDANSDTKIQLVSIVENRAFDDAIVLITTPDTIYTAVGSNVAATVMDCNMRTDDYTNGFMEYDSTICKAMDMCKVIHWLATGNVFMNKWVSNILMTATETIAKRYSLVSYEDFDCIRYCITTGYLIPIKE